jgi:DNA-binding winged helix-turn-helix (wHTH) protein/tetratricopeptide (TPR) repeat protein
VPEPRARADLLTSTSTPGAPIYRIDDIEIDVTRRCVRRSGNEVHLRPKTFQLLIHLIQHRDRLVTREELMDLFWKDTVVTDDSLAQCVSDLRRALGDSARDPQYVKTVPKTGYRFLGAVQDIRPVELIATEQITTIQIREEYTDDAPGGDLALLPPRRRWPWAVAVASLLLICIAAALRWYWPGAPAPPAGKRQIAVLRFENRSGQSDLDWLCQGLPEMLATTLSRTPLLNVLNREQLSLWLGRSGDSSLQGALNAARRSHAQVALLGTFARFGNSIRVDATIYDAQSGKRVASESITAGKPDDLLKQMDFLASRLAARMAAGSPGDDRRGLSSLMTSNLEAYRYYSLGLTNAETMHTEEAIRFFEKAIALDPGFVMAYARIGYADAVTSVQFAQGRSYLQKAFQMADRLTERDRRHILAWYAIANQDYPEAMRRYRELIAAYPDEAEAYYRLSVLVHGESRQEEAIELLHQALAIDPENPNFYNSLSVNNSEIGRHREAVEMAQRYLALSPRDANAYDTLGLAYQAAGLDTEALTAYNKALELNTGFEIAAAHRASLFMQMGRERIGMAEFQSRASSARWDFIRKRYWALAAWFHWRRGRMGQARMAIEQANRIRTDWRTWSPAALLLPGGEGATGPVLPYIPGRGSRFGVRTQYFYLAQDARMKHRPDEMLANLRQALRYRAAWSTAEPLEDALADGYFELGRLDDAISEYQRALATFPGMPRARFHLAQAYQRKGLHDEAKVQYRRLLEMWPTADPDLPEVVEAKRAIRQ